MLDSRNTVSLADWNSAVAVVRVDDGLTNGRLEGDHYPQQKDSRDRRHAHETGSSRDQAPRAIAVGLR